LVFEGSAAPRLAVALFHDRLGGLALLNPGLQGADGIYAPLVDADGALEQAAAVRAGVVGEVAATVGPSTSTVALIVVAAYKV
jgi:hypothetical protein